jgi:hypothetical protein
LWGPVLSRAAVGAGMQMILHPEQFAARVSASTTDAPFPWPVAVKPWVRVCVTAPGNRADVQSSQRLGGAHSPLLNLAGQSAQRLNDRRRFLIV